MISVIGNSNSTMKDITNMCETYNKCGFNITLVERLTCSDGFVYIANVENSEHGDKYDDLKDYITMDLYSFIMNDENLRNSPAVNNILHRLLSKIDVIEGV